MSDRLQGNLPTITSAATSAIFGTLSYVGVVLSALIVPVFALYLLIDFDRIVAYVRTLIPRRYERPSRTWRSRFTRRSVATCADN